MPARMGHERLGFYNTYGEECCKRNCIEVIKNNVGLCLPRALVGAKAHAKKEPQFVFIRKDIGKIQTSKAWKSIAKLRVCIPEAGAGIIELKKFQDHLNKIHQSVQFSK